MKAALYARVSTEEQARKGESIVDQLQALRAWATDNGYTIYKEYKDEGYSAHKAYKSRPALMEMISDIDSYDVIVFTKFDRWTRKAADYYKLQDILDKHNVVWKAILEDYDTMTSDGRFKVGIMLSVNQHEAERTSDRIKFTFEQKRARGELLSGSMPTGYILPPKSNAPQKDPEKAEAVQAFFETYLRGLGLSKAVAVANELGLGIKAPTASQMLRNAKHYSGHIQGVPCEPYITPEDAEFILSTRKTKSQPSKCVHLFSGLIRCGSCGKNFGCKSQSYTTKSGVKKVWYFYSCANRNQTYPPACPNSSSITEKDIEKYLVDNIGLVLADMVADAEKHINTHKKTKTATERITRLEKRKERAVNAYLDGLITKERLKAEQDAIDAEIAELSMPETEKTPEEIKAILPANWKDIYTSLSQEGKREFWFRIIDHITISENRKIDFVLRV